MSVQWKRLTRDLLNGKASKAEWAVTMAVAHNPSEKPRGRRKIASLAGLAEKTAEEGIREAEGNGRIELIPYEHPEPKDRGQAGFVIRLAVKYQTGVENIPVATEETGMEITPVPITGIENAPVGRNGATAAAQETGIENRPVIRSGIEITPVSEATDAVDTRAAHAINPASSSLRSEEIKQREEDPETPLPPFSAPLPLTKKAQAKRDAAERQEAREIARRQSAEKKARLAANSVPVEREPFEVQAIYAKCREVLNCKRIAPTDSQQKAMLNFARELAPDPQLDEAARAAELDARLAELEQWKADAHSGAFALPGETPKHKFYVGDLRNTLEASIALHSGAARPIARPRANWRGSPAIDGTLLGIEQNNRYLEQLRREADEEERRGVYAN